MKDEHDRIAEPDGLAHLTGPGDLIQLAAPGVSPNAAKEEMKMTASRSTRGAKERDSAHKLTVYEVDEFDTIRSLNAKELGFFADAFPAIDPGLMDTVEDVVQAGEDAPPLATRFEALLWSELESLKALVDESGPMSAQGKEARRHLRHLQFLERNGWQAWVREHGKDGLELLRQTTTAWLSTELHWSDFEWLPYDCGPQGQALSEFEALPREALDELGIKLVYGDRPGSTHYAAELTTDIDEANTVAERLCLGIRFVGQGASTDHVLPCAYLPPPPIDPLTFALERRFVPLFGLLPDIVARVVTDPAQVRTLPPQALQARHDRVLFQTAWDRIVKAIREHARESRALPLAVKVARLDAHSGSACSARSLTSDRGRRQ